VVVGTRPEVIKLAPVLWALAGDPSFEPIVCVVAQQGEILRRAVAEWAVCPALTVELPRDDHRLAATLASMLPRLADCIDEVEPDVVIVEGDTTTNVAAALAAFYADVPVAHVEAGLRTHDPRTPFPEEMHRRLVDRLASLHYAPTDGAVANLRKEGIDGEAVAVVGNTVVDALNAVIRQSGAGPSTNGHDRAGGRDRTLVVTAHRRESFGAGMVRICTAIRQLVTSRDDLRVVYVLHPNPNARGPVVELLGGLPKVELIEPRPYRDFVQLLRGAHIVLTDSGGIQEEAPYLGVPVLVTRPSTERPEAYEQGSSWLVGTSVSRIVSAVHRLLDDERLHAEMATPRAPFGDGNASARIVSHMGVRLQVEGRRVRPLGAARPVAVGPDVDQQARRGAGARTRRITPAQLQPEVAITPALATPVPTKPDTLEAVS
jgi:UDP-N-acetylglucosamine 2-epimerase (non-hydrolysing)